jgi:hypothetical protein
MLDHSKKFARIPAKPVLLFPNTFRTCGMTNDVPMSFSKNH